MQATTVSAVPTEKPAKKPPFEVRARSVPFKRAYIQAITVTAVFFLMIVGVLASLFAFFASPTTDNGILLAAFVALAIVFWIFSFAFRRNARCPLCKGTPLLDSSARCHEKAFRIFPLNYGTTNSIRCIARQHFRCQFCGTPFDLLKPDPHARPKKPLQQG